MLNTYTPGREPALYATLAGTAIKLIAAFWIDLSIDQQSLLNAAVAAIIGLLVAHATIDGQSAAILGLGQAMIALAIGFGLGIDAETQALIMSFVATIVSMYVRTQVTAPVPPS